VPGPVLMLLNIAYAKEKKSLELVNYLRAQVAPSD
jgi:hypothetical protein